MQHRTLFLHNNGPALWPVHKPLQQVLELRATTPESIWEGTYQGNPTPPGGSVFRREWWSGRNRYDAADRGLLNQVVGRWLSLDTGLKDTNSSAYTAAVVAELWPDYRMGVRYVFRERLEFPLLPEMIVRLGQQFNQDLKLRGILIEDKASGISAYQTLMATAPEWLQGLLIAFNPSGDKITRASQAAVWCRNECVLLPEPSTEVGWLFDFEQEVFEFPNSAYMDQVDAFGQLIIWLEHLLAEGWHARVGNLGISEG